MEIIRYSDDPAVAALQDEDVQGIVLKGHDGDVKIEKQTPHVYKVVGPISGSAIVHSPVVAVTTARDIYGATE
jgi:hypothetical protein